jgi:release factor glutamine methyltransferase
MTTIREARRLGRARLHDSPSPALDARLLLEHVLDRNHAALVAHDDEVLPADALDAYRRLLDRAAAGEPIPYLTGRAPFLGLEFAVSPDVLIPRPETEGLVEYAIDWARRRGDPIRAVDVGAGSGCIAVSLAHYLPEADVCAVDISAGALAVARANAARHAPGRVAFIQGSLLESLAPRFDLILSNPPYVAEDEWTELPIGVKSYEPALALYGGGDGLDVIRALLPQAAGHLRPGGLCLLEIGWRHGEAAAALARAAFPGATVAVRPDFAGRDRMVVIQR